MRAELTLVPKIDEYEALESLAEKRGLRLHDQAYEFILEGLERHKVMADSSNLRQEIKNIYLRADDVDKLSNVAEQESREFRDQIALFVREGLERQEAMRGADVNVPWLAETEKHKIKKVTLWLSPEDYDLIEEFADKDCRAITHQILWVLRRWCESERAG